MGFPRNDDTKTNLSMRRAAIWAQEKSHKQNLLTSSIYGGSTLSNPKALTVTVSNLGQKKTSQEMGNGQTSNIGLESIMRYGKDSDGYMHFLPYFDWYVFNNIGATITAGGSIRLQFAHRTGQGSLYPLDDPDNEVITAGLSGMWNKSLPSSGSYTSVAKSLTRRSYNDNLSDTEYRWPTRDQSGSFGYYKSNGLLNGVGTRVSYSYASDYDYGTTTEAGYRTRPSVLPAVETTYYFKSSIVDSYAYRAFGWCDVGKRFDKDGWETEPIVTSIKATTAAYIPLTTLGTHSNPYIFQHQDTWDCTSDDDVKNLADQFDPETGAWCFPETTSNSNYQPSGTGYEDVLAHHFCIGLRTELKTVAWSSSFNMAGSLGVAQYQTQWHTPTKE